MACRCPQVVLVPTNIGGNHWVLLAVYPPQRKIVVYDSLAGNTDVVVAKRSLGRYGQELRALEMALAAAENKQANDCYRRMSGVKRWDFEIGVSPQQLNGDDCGVMVAMAMVSISMSTTRTVGEWAISQAIVDEARIHLGGLIVAMGMPEDVLIEETRQRAIAAQETPGGPGQQRAILAQETPGGPGQQALALRETVGPGEQALALKETGDQEQAALVRQQRKGVTITSSR